jgi:hypothetical protein
LISRTTDTMGRTNGPTASSMASVASHAGATMIS